MPKASSMIEGLSGASLIAACFLLAPVLRGKYQRWGATNAEVEMSLHGDKYVPRPKGVMTQAITIHASAAEVWPWIVQIGQGRGGFYSYEFLENVTGCNIRNADRIIPELQDLQVGDPIYLYPKTPPLPVAVIEKESTLVLSSLVNQETGEFLELNAPIPEQFVSQSWAWYLYSENRQKTRLITRFLVDYSPSLGNRLGFGPIIGIISSVMSRKMLLGIKKRAEAHLQQ